MTTSTISSEEDVLDAFSIEPDHGRATLDAYLRAHPAHASALVALSFELSRTDLGHRELSGDEEELVAKAWERRRAAAGAVAANPVAPLAPRERQALARDLGIRAQVISLFRDGRIDVETVPRRFLSGFAARLGIGLDALRAGLAVPAPAAAQSFKSDAPPEAGGRVDFERALRQSGAGEDDIAALTADD
jgi:hypothetical protein